MTWLQIRFFGPDFSSFLPHSYGYAPANELKSVLEASNFRFSPYSPTASWMPGFFLSPGPPPVGSGGSMPEARRRRAPCRERAKNCRRRKPCGPTAEPAGNHQEWATWPWPQEGAIGPGFRSVLSESWRRAGLAPGY